VVKAIRQEGRTSQHMDGAWWMIPENSSTIAIEFLRTRTVRVGYFFDSVRTVRLATSYGNVSRNLVDRRLRRCFRKKRKIKNTDKEGSRSTLRPRCALPSPFPAIGDVAYRQRAGGGPSYRHRQHAQTFGKDRACGCGDILADRQTDRQTYSSQYFATAPAGEVSIISQV